MPERDWPSPDSAYDRPHLPRLDDLPPAELGYDREKVREAFDAFYRHAAELDAALKTLEAVEVFQRSAGELRAELRAIRAAGFTVQGSRGAYVYERRGPRLDVPEALPRILAETAFLILVAAAVAVAGLSTLWIVAVMGAALAIVWLLELVSSRERGAAGRPAPAQLPRPPAEEPKPAAAASPAPADSAGWSAFESREEAAPEAMTMLGVEAPEAEAEPEEGLSPEGTVPSSVPKTDPPLEPQAEPVAVVEPEEEPAEPQPEGDLPAAAAAAAVVPVISEQPRRRWFRRRHAEPEQAAPEPAEVAEEVGEAEPEPAEQAPPDEAAEQHVDPWEQELDLSVEGEELEPEPEPEPEPELGRRRFWLLGRRGSPAPEAAAAAGLAAASGPVSEALEPEPVSEALEPEQVAEEPEPDVEFEADPEATAAEEDGRQAVAEPDEPDEEQDALADPEEPQDLPVDVLAEQASAAIERSRARRPAARRSRRR